ncbi:hypothetical protein M9H77_26244 [Catharanthus roseus]|uniref:Uncharacterized protein n=1 Tax=Catharanthus roseus TaxID=4058 RepID=A0ACC0AD62_CATRO|nr:hypothetical protein M9H77_26244 [Catharanthus roseus]
MESEMRDLTTMLDEISTGPISKVKECHRLMKGILCPVLPEDPCALLTSPPEPAVTKGRRKTNSTKRDKSYWEHMSIAHRKIGKSSGSGSGLGSSSTSGSGSNSRGRDRLPRVPRGRDRGRSSGRSSFSSVVNPCTPVRFPYIDALPVFVYESIHSWKNVIGDGNCGFRVVVNFLFGDENHWPEVRRRMTFDLQLHLNMYAQLFGSLERVYRCIQRTQWFDGLAPEEHWLEIPDHLWEEPYSVRIAD